MSDAERNKATIARALEGTAQGDGRTFVGMLADDAVWTIIGSTSWSRTFTGKPAILGDLLRPLGNNLSGANIITAGRILADGDTVMAEGQNHSTTRRGEAYPNRYVWVFTFRGEQVIDVLEYCDTALVERLLEPCPTPAPHPKV